MSADLVNIKNPSDLYFRERVLLELLHNQFHTMGLDPESEMLPGLKPTSLFCTELDTLKNTFNVEKCKRELQEMDYKTRSNRLQKILKTEVCKSVKQKQGRAFFWQGRSGTGKTFTAKWLLASLRAQGKLALATATTGIAAIQYEKGTTGHFLWKISIKKKHSTDATSNLITPGTQRHALLSAVDLIIVDEISMWEGKTLDTVDKIMQDIRGNNKPFGGVTMLFIGDFLQLPCVIPNAYSIEEIDRHMVHHSKVWKTHVELFALKQSQRQKNNAEFYDTLQEIGEGRLPLRSENNKIPLIPATYNVDEAHKFIHPNPGKDMELLTNSALVVATNAMVDKHNSRLQEQNPRQINSFYSCDTYLYPDKTELPLTDANFDFMRNCNKNGVPPHQLRLKIGDPIMLLRNLDPANELVNGTRGILTNISPNRRILIIRIRRHNGVLEDFPIPRIDFELKLESHVFDIRRRQFPIRCAYAMTIHKCQSLTLDRIVLDLRTPLIPTCTGALYVALSRTRRINDTLILTRKINIGDDGFATNANSYYSEALINYVLAIELHMDTWTIGSSKKSSNDIITYFNTKNNPVEDLMDCTVDSLPNDPNGFNCDNDEFVFHDNDDDNDISMSDDDILYYDSMTD